jgi:tryptophan-rich sensory protein
MVLRRPFTLQYARERVAPSMWTEPKFIPVNYIITAVWALAFAVLVVIDAAMVYDRALPTRDGIIVTVLALVGAFKFTAWYPARASARNSLA